MSTIERYFAPQTLDEAAAVLSRGGATILAGGTDLMPQTQSGKVKFQGTLLNIRRIAELRGIGIVGGAIRIGALATVTELLTDPLVLERIPVLAQAADCFASDQLRNVATLGGNICNASPAGDMLIPLLVLDAEVELASKPDRAVNRRRMPLREFFVGPGRTRREPQELVAAVWMPLPRPGFTARFFKFGTRPALDISTISIGIGGVRDAGRFTGVRVAFGAVAPTPVRAPNTEAVLEGRALDEAAIDAAAYAAREEVKPISDVRASAWYRKELVHNMTRRMLEDVAASGN